MTITAVFDNIAEMVAFAHKMSGVNQGSTVKPSLTAAPDKPRASKAPARIEAQEEEEQTEPVQEEQTAVAEDPQDEGPEYSLEQVRAKLAELQKTGKRAEVKTLLNDFGVAKLSEIAPEQYGELMEKAGEI